MKKTLVFSIVLVLSMFLSGCGYVHFGQPKELQPVEISKVFQIITVNQEAVGYLTSVVQAHKEDYTEDELKLMLKAIGALDSLMAYSKMIASTGEATVCVVETVWQQAQINYYAIVKTVKTDTWKEGDRILFDMTINEAKHLANIVDESLKDAGDNASRADMDAILGQIGMWAGTALTLM